MRRSLSSLFAAACGLIPVGGTALADTPTFNPGKWTVTNKMEIPGMPMQVPPITSTQCLTKDKPTPSDGRHDNKDCKTTELKFDGHKVTWAIQCTGKQPVEGHGEVVYANDAFTGTMTMKTPNPRGGGTMEIHSTMQGKRVGDCK